MNELMDVCPLSCYSLRQRQSFSCSAPFSFVEFHLCQLFGRTAVRRPIISNNSSNSTTGHGKNVLVIMDAVILEELPDGVGRFQMEWQGNPLNDMIADAVVAVAFHAETSRTSVRMTKSLSSGHGHSHGHGHDHSMMMTGHDGATAVDSLMAQGTLARERMTEHLDVVMALLSEFFQDISIDEDSGNIQVRTASMSSDLDGIDGQGEQEQGHEQEGNGKGSVALIDAVDLSVSCRDGDEHLKLAIEQILARLSHVIL